MQAPFGISIIVCCYNSEKVIKNTLKALSELIITKETPLELIIVNNNSTDATEQLCKSLWENHYPMHIIQEEKPGLFQARQAGIAKASYKIVSFIDDDNLVPPNWVKFLSEKFEDPNLGIVGVKTTLVANYPIPTWFSQHQEAFACSDLYKQNWADITNQGLVFGAGMTLRKQIYTDLTNKNWEAQLTGRIGKIQAAGDDSEICLAARLLDYKIYYTNLLTLGHAIQENRLNASNLASMYQGFGVADVGLHAYNYYWKHKTATLGPLWKLRKYRWVNIVAKSIQLIKLSLLNLLPNTDSLLIKTMVARNKAYINHCLKHPELWEKYAKNAQKLLK
jgi:glycosyltransferase involved in cell wall biosynthesis